MRVAIIGAGVAGLCVTRFVSEAFPDATIDVFEVASCIGGVWVYNERVGLDEFGVPILTNMYQNLRANLPKITMQLSDFPFPESYKEFQTQSDFLAYLQNYAVHFGLYKFIKFRHHVTKVKRLESCWEIKFDDLRGGSSLVREYDYVYVCSGHYHHSFVPEIKGADIYKGVQMHSHAYRKPEEFADKTVLLIGAGPSGFDLSVAISKFAKKVYLSHHMTKLIPMVNHVTHKPDIQEFTENEVVFQDGSKLEVDQVVYCTGYDYYFPFLDENCGIKIHNTHLEYLYHHIVNVEYTSMFFIGIPTHCCAIVLRDMQARYTVSLMKKNFKLPSKEMMLEILQKMIDKKRKDGKADKLIHDLYYDEDEYFQKMADESGVKRVLKVCSSIRKDILKAGIYIFRNYKYHIVDDENYYITEEK